MARPRTRSDMVVLSQPMPDWGGDKTTEGAGTGLLSEKGTSYEAAATAPLSDDTEESASKEAFEAPKNQDFTIGDANSPTPTKMFRLSGALKYITSLPTSAMSIIMKTARRDGPSKVLALVALVLVSAGIGTSVVMGITLATKILVSLGIISAAMIPTQQAVRNHIEDSITRKLAKKVAATKIQSMARRRLAVKAKADLREVVAVQKMKEGVVVSEKKLVETINDIFKCKIKKNDIIELVLDATMKDDLGLKVLDGITPLTIYEVKSGSWASGKGIVGYNWVGVGEKDKDEIYILDGASGYYQTLETLEQIIEGMSKNGKNLSFYFIPSVGVAVGGGKRRRKRTKRKSTKRKATRRKSTKRKATKRKSTRRKATRRKSTKRRRTMRR